MRQLSPFAMELLEIGSTAVGLSSDKYLLADRLFDGAFELWTSATVPKCWTPSIAGTSSVNREGTTIKAGTYGLNLNIDGSESNASVFQAFSMVAGRYYTLDFYYRNSTSGKTAKVTIADSGLNKYLTSAGAWQAAATYITLVNSNATWTQYTLTFPADSYTEYTITFANLVALSSIIYIDSVRLVEANTQRGGRFPEPAIEAFGVLETGQIRYGKGGIVPTATIGQPLEIGQNYMFDNFDDIRSWKGIKTGATSGLMTVEYRR